MKKLLTITAAAMSLLAAGVVAVAATPPVPAASAVNVTIIDKNQTWPIKGRISMHPCQIATCQEV